MDPGVIKTRRKACMDVLRIFVSIVIVFMLVWIVQTGYDLVTKPRRDNGDHGYENNGYIAVVFGVATVVFGMVYFIVGLTIVVELVLEFLGWLQGDDCSKLIIRQEKRGISQVYIQAATIIVSVLMFTWAMYQGCRIAVATPKSNIHNCLTFVIGFTTMAFGFVYFIIGISIVAESALYLSRRFQHAITETNICDNQDNDELLPV